MGLRPRFLNIMPDGRGPEAPPTLPKSLVLAAHGSRCGGAASALRKIAARLEKRDLSQQVLTSFHQGQPAFGQVPGLVSGDGVVVVPVFLAEGYYSRKVLPRELLRAPRFRPIDIWLTPVVGCDSRLPLALLKRVRRLIRRLGWNPQRTAVVVLGHGTPRSSTSSRTTHQATAFLRSEGPCKTVHAAFLDDRPTPREALQGTDADHCVVLPLLFGSGDHAGELAQLFGLGEHSGSGFAEITGRDSKGRDYVIDRPVGEDPVLVEIIEDLVQSRVSGSGSIPQEKLLMSAEGIVYLVGAGPGDPDLITLKGFEVLKKADVVVYDRLINKRLLLHAPVLCELIEAGKSPGGPRTPQRRINQVLVEKARQGKKVVRLKGGDPFVFGRGGEELLYCREAEVRCEVVPGVTSALAGPASLQIPATHREMAHNLTIVSGHSGDLDYATLARLDTVIILMGHVQLAPICRSLIQAGRAADTPAAVVQWATTQRQQSVVADLGSLAEQVEKSHLNAPVVVIIGQVVDLTDSDTAAQSGLQQEMRAVESI